MQYFTCLIFSSIQLDRYLDSSAFTGIAHDETGLCRCLTGGGTEQLRGIARAFHMQVKLQRD
jgi:hypothetical protein